MSDRIFIGFSGGVPLFRISKTGKSVYSADPTDFVIREDMATFYGYITGSVTFTGQGEISVPISGFTRPPFVLMKSSTGELPTFNDWFGYINNEMTQLRIVSRRTASRTIRYAIYRNEL